MSDARAFGSAFLLAGAGLVAAYLLWPDTAQGPIEGFRDTPGPNLVIEVGGSTSGTVVIDLLPTVAPAHVERITRLAADGDYDGIVFHRVIDGFMAQTGDVTFGRPGSGIERAGQGGSRLPDLKAEFSDVPFQRGVVGMARAAAPDTANSQFFIMFAAAPHLDGKYTAVGRVVSGMDVIDDLKRGDSDQNGTVVDADYMERVTVVDE